MIMGKMIDWRCLLNRKKAQQIVLLSHSPGFDPDSVCEKIPHNSPKQIFLSMIATK